MLLTEPVFCCQTLLPRTPGHGLVHEVTYFPSFHDICSNASLQMPFHLHPSVAAAFASTARALSPGFRACLPSFAWRDLSEVLVSTAPPKMTKSRRQVPLSVVRSVVDGLPYLPIHFSPDATRTHKKCNVLFPIKKIWVSWMLLPVGAGSNM